MGGGGTEVPRDDVGVHRGTAHEGHARVLPGCY